MHCFQAMGPSWGLQYSDPQGPACQLSHVHTHADTYAHLRSLKKEQQFYKLTPRSQETGGWRVKSWRVKE